MKYWDIFLHRRLFFNLFATGILMTAMSFGSAILAPRLQKTYGVSTTVMGLIFALPLILAAVSPVVVNFLSARFENRLIISVALVLVSVSFLMIGPSETLGFPEELYLMCIGLVLMGFCCGTALIPLFPDFVEYGVYAFGDTKANIEIISALYGSGFNFGHLFGPIMGSNFTVAYGFRICCDLIALIMVGSGVLYFIGSFDKTMFRLKKPHDNAKTDDLNTSVRKSLSPLYLDNSFARKHHGRT